MKGRIWNITDREEVSKLAGDLLAEIVKPAKDRAVVLALYGDLGAGKTTLTQELARQLGIVGGIASPTFVVMKRYPANQGGFLSLIHIDAYRLEDTEELEVLGVNEWLREAGTLMVIEWADKVEALLSEDAVRLRLEDEGGKRTAQLI